MHRFDGYDIELTRGDSLCLRIRLRGRDLPAGARALFTVRTAPRAEETVLEKRTDIADGETLIVLSSADTDLKARVYFWDLRVFIPGENGFDELETPMEYAAFTIVEAIGSAQTLIEEE